MAMFHFTLNPNGYLFLGSSETIGGAADLFTTIDLKWKIFQRKGSVAPAFDRISRHEDAGDLTIGCAAGRSLPRQ